MTTQVQKVAASLRERAGKGNARATRNEGRVPAVIYGGKEKPIMISLEEKGLTALLKKPGFYTHLIDVEAGGKTVRVLPRDVQFHPVTDRAEHVDFLRVSANTRVRVHVPVVFINQDKSPGLKRGGVLNIVQHELQVLCAPESIPEKITVDVDGLNIGDTIHIEKLKLPADVTPVISGKADTTVASIAAPTTVKEEVVTPAADAAAATPAAGAAAPAAGAAAAPAAGAAKGAAPAAAAKAPAKK